MHGSVVSTRRAHEIIIASTAQIFPPLRRNVFRRLYCCQVAFLRCISVNTICLNKPYSRPNMLGSEETSGAVKPMCSHTNTQEDNKHTHAHTVYCMLNVYRGQGPSGCVRSRIMLLITESFSAQRALGPEPFICKESRSTKSRKAGRAPFAS